VIRFVSVALALVAFAGVEESPRLTVSVAASMNDALVEISSAYTKSTGVAIDLNVGGSNTLARQIAAGAPVDLFLSADEAQMDVVALSDRIVKGTRTTLVTNELAVIVPLNSQKKITQASDLAGGAVTKLAMGDPAAVPVGVYGRKWLEKQRVWTAVEPKVIPFPTVLSVLSAVDAGRVDAGIVYKTDAIARSTVKVAITVSAKTNPEVAVIYPAAVIRGANEAAAKALLAHLKGPSARAVFTRKGFGVP
jgi:molybdate transport system substrate-binding protein